MNHIWYQNKKIASSKIVCIGRNYLRHIEELGNEIPQKSVIFCKPNSAISPIIYDFGSNCRFEGELCFLIEENKAIGVGFGFDLTKVDEQEYAKAKGLPWERAKAFDASAVMSEFVKLERGVKGLHFKLYQNGTLVQNGGYDLMIHKPEQIIKRVNEFMSFEDGDILMSGTPEGVGSFCVGDTFVAKVYDKDTLLLESRFVVKPHPRGDK